ncbi:Stealth-like protein [Aminobacter aminovorans]|uniref:Capsular polysaccharide phosphotransferase SacB n=1 Tax=Aminobacter aminovorans TaxID=83263 RepID=A0A380WQ82_AMIAI|nr:Stealth CR1 domain-containing protein [Aminobacter aminovorans]TCS30191.1 Stealth-like protein [Aminobacter aminovorans]SUU91040.1 Capsular polysaccharide phosphotransferase SacB [Aminobacter aminovorans]
MALNEFSDPIDVVMPWVDGSDPAHRDSLLRHWPKRPWLRPAPYRYRENGELRYALRSIHFHLPWVRTIHLVTNGQVPSWLDLDHPGINLITHGDFFAEPSSLPVFSSSAIEANLHGIGRAGVADRFLLFNDDFFVGQSVPREEFITPDGRSRLHVMSARLPRFRLWADRYRHTLAFNNLLLCLAFRRRRWSYPPHVPLLMERDRLAWLNAKFGFWLRRTARHRFRQRTDGLARVLYINAVPERDRGRPDGALQVKLTCEHVIAVRDDDAFSRSLAQLLRQPPAFFCLNDEIDDDARAAVRALEMQAALGAIFPEPAPFEKARREIGLELTERSGT